MIDTQEESLKVFTGKRLHSFARIEYFCSFSELKPEIIRYPLLVIILEISKKLFGKNDPEMFAIIRS